MRKRAKTEESAADAAGTDRQFVTALARGLEVLRCFTARRRELGTTEIALLTGLPQPTVWRLCYTLIKTGYLTPSQKADKLCIGVGVFALGYEAIAAMDIGELVQREMQIVADEFQCAVSLATPDRLDMVIVKRAQTNSRLVVNLQVGSRLPIAASTAGWAYLATLPAPQRTQLLRRLEAHYGKHEWSAKWRTANAAIKSFPKNGYVLSGGAYDPEINAVGVPIRTDDDAQFLALVCGAPASTVPIRTFQLEIAPSLIRLAAFIRSTLPHSGPQRALR